MSSPSPVAAREQDPSRPDGRGRLLALLGIYLVLLVWIVLWKLGVPYVGDGPRVVKLVPFLPTAEAGVGDPFELVVNVLLFVPLGLYLGLLAPGSRWWKGAGAVAGLSLLLEVAQWLLAVGRSDVTDLVLNTAGGLAGMALAALARRRLRSRATAVMLRVGVTGTVLLLVLVSAFLISPVRIS